MHLLLLFGETNLDFPLRHVGQLSLIHIFSYVDYAEGIYIGYKWYETADAEGYWDAESNEHGTGYDAVVQYPFGYGLSYTSFDWEVTDASANGSTLTKDGNVTVKVTVTNTCLLYTSRCV